MSIAICEVKGEEFTTELTIIEKQTYLLKQSKNFHRESPSDPCIRLTLDELKELGEKIKLYTLLLER